MKYSYRPNRLTYEYVKSKIEELGFTLISTEYVNCSTKLKILCPYGHEVYSNWNSFSYSKGICKTCSGKKSPAYEEVKEEIELKGFSLLSEKYSNNHTKLEMICSVGHKVFLSWDVFRRGIGCSKCSNKSKLDIAYVRDFIEKNGFILKSKKYVNNVSKLKLICPNNHSILMSWHDFFTGGNRCALCNVYKNEEKCRAIFEHITGYKFPKVRPKWFINPNTNYPLELDGYCEELKLAFEYDGEQHFKEKCFSSSYDLSRVKERDLIKNDISEKHGIILIRIPYFVEDIERHIKLELERKWHAK